MIVNTMCTITHTALAGTTAWYSVPFTYITVLNVPQLSVTLNDVDLTYGTDYVVGVSGLRLLKDHEAGDELVITRNTPRTQETDFQTGMIDPDEIESALDLAAMRDQELDTAIERAAAMPLDHEVRLNEIEREIPAEASNLNKLADKQYVNDADAALQTQITTHGLRTDNPHSVTKAQVGLGNCDNTSDLDKPVSTATQAALDNKVTKNADITGRTKCKITYDSKGLVTGGEDITMADLTNINITSPVNGQFLSYDAATNKWVNRTSSVVVGFDGITGSPRDNTALATELDKYVTLAGAQTIAGIKTFNKGALVVKNNNTYDGTNHYNGVLTIQDSTGTVTGFVRNVYSNTNSDTVDIQAVKNINGTTIYAGLGVTITATGDVYAFGPNVGSANSSKTATQLATKGWANDPSLSLNVVHRDGTETITGIKTFSTVAYGFASDAQNSIATTVNKSKGESGYFQFGNGLIVQWGLLRATGSSRNVTFPKAFSNAGRYAVTVTPTGSNTGTLYNVSVNNNISTGFTVLSGGNVDNVWLFWIAIGW